MPLTDLYQITGTTDTEPATFITVTVADDAAVTDVQAALQATYPELQIRTNRQQLETTLERQVLVVAAGGALVVVAVGAGITLTFSLFALIVYQQRREFAIMSAQGISPSIVIIVVITEGLAIGTLAAAVAGWQLTRTPPLTHLE